MTSENYSKIALRTKATSKFNELTRLARHFIGLLVVGVLIGLACLPLNLVDRIQEWLFGFLPTRGQADCRTVFYRDRGKAELFRRRV